jgi:hypothetical protein
VSVSVSAAALRKADRENRDKYDWWVAYRSAEKRGRAPQRDASPSVWLIRRSPKSFVIVFPAVPGSE